MNFGPVLWLQGPNVIHKFLRDRMLNFGKLTGWKTYLLSFLKKLCSTCTWFLQHCLTQKHADVLCTWISPPLHRRYYYPVGLYTVHVHNKLFQMRCSPTINRVPFGGLPLEHDAGIKQHQTRESAVPRTYVPFFFASIDQWDADTVRRKQYATYARRDTRRALHGVRTCRSHNSGPARPRASVSPCDLLRLFLLPRRSQWASTHSNASGHEFIQFRSELYDSASRRDLDISPLAV